MPRKKYQFHTEQRSLQTRYPARRQPASAADLSNLLSNAVKFTATGGQVTLDITQQQADSADQTVLTMGRYRYRLRYVGTNARSGLPALEQEDGSTARKYGGSGLGLSIVKYLVD